jgi:unsaturated rhamnogalacturonyl hydrolase
MIQFYSILKCSIVLFFFVISQTIYAQKNTWVDSLDHRARTEILPAKKYHWTWQNAALLNTIKAQYEIANSEKKDKYLAYIRKAMDRKLWRANGKSPNAVASGLGMAFLARVTGEEKYKRAADKIFEDYNKIPKTDNGGVSHLRNYQELWDDTIFMVGSYLREMYLLTRDEKYLNELLLQVEVHREKLKDDHWGLWYHGWDGDDKNRSNFICGQKGWSNTPKKRSEEIWGRGNGWVIVTLAQTVSELPDSLPQRTKLAAYLKEMLLHLPELQDTETGHWYQLPVRKNEEGNFIESSCTAMFGYGILIGLREGIIEGEDYEKSVKKAFYGLRKYSIRKVKNELITMNVCNGTCIGDNEYYFNRKTKREKSFGLGMFILFGRTYLHM